MNRVERPTFFDDHAALVALAQNHHLRSYPHLQSHVAAIRGAYLEYVAAEGDVSAITGVALPPEIGALLKGHYSDPPVQLPHIARLRDDGRIRTCPMCGSVYGYTLDHIMPKGTNPCFAIFGLNLVPACQCNTLRTSQSTGATPGERILHPYFDDIMGERLLVARFEDLGPVPRVGIRIVLDTAHPAYGAVHFHATNVVKRTHVTNWIALEWSKLVLRPGNVIRFLSTNPLTRADLVAIIENERVTVDDALGSRNSWQSMLLGGLLEDDVLDWLFAAFRRPGRDANGPLVPE